MLFKKHYKKILIVVSILLLSISIYFHLQDDYQVYRTLRGAVSFTFLGYLFYIHRGETSMLLVAFFALFGCSSLLSVWYELPKLPEIMLGLNFLSYMSLILYLKPKIGRKKMTALYWVILMSLIFINGYLLYQLVEMIKVVDKNNMSYIIMIVSAIGMVFLGMTTLLYNFTQSTTASLVFTVFVFVLIFAEVFRAIGYYGFAYGDVAVYIARTLLILSSALLIHYTVVNDKEKIPRVKELL